MSAVFGATQVGALCPITYNRSARKRRPISRRTDAEYRCGAIVDRISISTHRSGHFRENITFGCTDGISLGFFCLSALAAKG